MSKSTWSRRDFLHRTAFGVGGIAVVGAGSGLLSACARTGEGGTLGDVKDAGTVKIGIANERPYGYTEGGQVTGEAPEVAKAVFKEMGIDNVEPEAVSFSALISSLRNETYDVIAAGMFITPERCQEIIFSEPDYCAQTAFLILRGSPAEGVTNFKDIAANPEIKLGTLGQGAVEFGYAVGNGVAESQIVPIQEAADGYEQLAAGRIHVFTLTRPSLALQAEENPDPNIILSEPFFPVVDGEEQKGCGGYGFRQGDEEFRDEFNENLQKLQDEGRIFELVEQFGFTEEEVGAAAEESTENLCGGNA